MENEVQSKSVNCEVADVGDFEVAYIQRQLEKKLVPHRHEIELFETIGLEFQREEDFKMYQAYLELMSTEQGIKGRKINRCNYERRKRCRKRIIRYQMSNKAVFGTLTINNDMLEKISEQSFRKYVQRYMKEYFVSYIANVDFGSENERIHYHVVGVPKNSWYEITEKKKVFNDHKQKWQTIICTKVWCEWVGYDYWEELGTDEHTPGKVAKYIDKLANHAFKVSTKNSRIIYSRGDLFEHLEELSKFKR